MPVEYFLTIVHVDIVYTTDGSSVPTLHVLDRTKMVTEMMCRIRLANHVQGFHVDYIFGQVLAPVGHRHRSCFGGDAAAVWPEVRSAVAFHAITSRGASALCHPRWFQGREHRQQTPNRRLEGGI